MNITLIHESAFSIHSYDMFMNITWIITLIHESAVSMERVIKSSFEQLFGKREMISFAFLFW